MIFINRRKPFFKLVSGSEDFTDEAIRRSYEKSIEDLAAYHNVFRIKLDIRKIDAAEKIVKITKEVIIEITNLSRTAPYISKKRIVYQQTNVAFVYRRETYLAAQAVIRFQSPPLQSIAGEVKIRKRWLSRILLFKVKK